MVISSKVVENNGILGVSRGIVNWDAKLKTELEEGLLGDIGFDLSQLKELRTMYKQNLLNSSGKIFQEMIASVSDSLKNNIKQYEDRYGRKPKIEDVRRIFSRDRRTA